MPDRPRAPHVTFVDRGLQIDDALQEVDGEIVGVDVERADAHRYFRRAALVQVGIEGRCVLLDGVTLDALPALDDFFAAGRLAVLHAAHNDLEPLAAKQVTPARIADTAVAAAVLGLPTGLGGLLDEVLGLQLDGDKSAYQRADWEQRPLPDAMVDYAAGDVVHLPLLWTELSGRLDATGRRSWYDEELAWTIERNDQETRSWTRVKGSGRLTPPQRALLRALWEERERITRTHDIAPNYLIHDEVLRELAIDPPRTEQQLVRRSQRRRALLRTHAEALLAAVERGREAEPEPKARSSRWTEDDRALFEALRQRRAQVAEELGVDAGVLCPSQQLWGAIGGDPQDGRELCALAGLRTWQTEVLAEPLWEAYLEARAAGDSDGAG